MARSRSRLTAEIEFDDGKQHGFIRLPYSVHRSAYGWIPIPVACIKKGDGPRVLLMAGNHGDENSPKRAGIWRMSGKITYQRLDVPRRLR